MIQETMAALCHLEARLGQLNAQREQLRTTLLTHALDEMERTGAAPTWRTETGTVGLTVPKATPVIVDEEAFAVFAAQRWGEEVTETVVRVRPKDVRVIFRNCSESLSNASLVTTDGERLPGVVLRSKFPFLSVRLHPEAKMAALADDTEQVS